jgi:hypothetical protein
MLENVLTFLLNHESFLQGVFFLLLAILVLILSRGPVTLKVGDKELTMGNQAKKEAGKGESDTTKELLCQSCKRAVFDETKRRVKLVMWHRKNLYRDQRKYAENKIGSLSQAIWDDYSELLSKYLVDVDIRTERSYLLFKVKVIDFMEGYLMPRIESVLEENHIATKTADQWKEHKSLVLEGVYMDMGKFLEANYSCEEVPRDVMEEFLKSKWPTISGKVLEILDQARALAQACDVNVKEVKKYSDIKIFGKDTTW